MIIYCIRITSFSGEISIVCMAICCTILKNWMHFFVVLLTCKSVDRSTFHTFHSALQAKNLPRSTLLHAYKTTKNAFNSYNYITSVFHWNVTIWLVMKWSHDDKRDALHPNKTKTRTMTTLDVNNQWRSNWQQQII